MARILDFLLNLVKVTGESLAEDLHDLEQRTDELKTHFSPLVSLSFHIMSLYVDRIFQPKIPARESTHSVVLMGSIVQNISNQNCLGKTWDEWPPSL